MINLWKIIINKSWLGAFLALSIVLVINSSETGIALEDGETKFAIQASAIRAEDSLLENDVEDNIAFKVVNNSYGYKQDYYKKSKKDKQKTAILVIGYNRPEYLVQVVSSLEKNPASQSLPFFFVFDGGPQAKQQENINIVKRSTIKHKEIVLRSTSYGCGRNLIDARRMLFDWCEYDRIVFFEDDVVVTPEYINLVLNLDEWAHKNYDNIGFTTAYCGCFLSLPEKLKYLSHVGVGVSCIGYCIRRGVWNKIKPIIYEYENKFLKDVLYNRRNSQAIRKWLKATYDRSKPVVYSNPFKSKQNIIAHFIHDKSPTSQDGITMFALLLNGYVPLLTRVNRAVNIGKYGLHFTPSLWEKLGFGKIKLDRFKQDYSLKEFIAFDAKKSNLEEYSWKLKEDNSAELLAIVNGLYLNAFFNR